MEHMAYDNFVLENKIEDILTTKVDMNNYLTADYSLTENPGNIKKVHKYRGVGLAEDLGMGEGNSDSVEVMYTENEYLVKTTQNKFCYYDEQAAADPAIVEAGLDAIAKNLVNDLTDKAIKEYEKAPIQLQTTTFDFDAFADAIGKLDVEDEEGFFALINPETKATLRKALGDDLKYSEGFARTGYIGTVCGIPVIVSKAVPKNEVIIASKDAITAFIKKGVEVEQDRNIDTRENTIVARKVAVVALTDDTKVVRMGNFTNIGACSYSGGKFTVTSTDNGARIVIYDKNMVQIGTGLVASNTCSITYAAKSGEEYTVQAIASGKLTAAKKVIA